MAEFPAGQGTTEQSERRMTSPEQACDELVAAAAGRAPDIAALLRLYYRHTPAAELLGDDIDNLIGAVRSHQQLARQRIPGKPTVRLFNPTRAVDGWSKDATVIQIVTDDMPYLVDSVIAELTRHNARAVRVVHPIVVVSRDIAGELENIQPRADVAAPPEGVSVESWMYLEIELVTDRDRIGELDRRLNSVLGDVREVVEDTGKMAETARWLADELERVPSPLSRSEIEEGAGLLRWLADGNFTFLGYRRNELVTTGEHELALRGVLASGLGVLRQDSIAARGLMVGPDTAGGAPGPSLLVLTRAGASSTVYRPVHPYYVGVKTFDADGNVTGEHRFLGMFTRTALHEDVLDIPVVAGRVRAVVRRAGFPTTSYSGQRMLEVLQNWPRADLFSADTDWLYATATGAITLADQRRLRLFVRRDPYGWFFSCVLFLPRDRYTTSTQQAMQQVLLHELVGTEVEYTTRLGETVLAQVHFTVYSAEAGTLEPDTPRIQQRLNDAVRSWSDRMVDAVLEERRLTLGAGVTQPDARVTESASERGERLAARFSDAYREDFSASQALVDLNSLAGLSAVDDIAMSFYTPQKAAAGERRFKLLLRRSDVTLSNLLPLLQQMGVEVLDQRPYELHGEDGSRSWIYDFGLHVGGSLLDGFAASREQWLRERFEDAFGATWRGHCEVDGFNALVLWAGLTWQQVTVLRAYARYLRQTGTPYSQQYIKDTLLANIDITTALVELFELRFDIAGEPHGRGERVAEHRDSITRMVDEVTSLDEDRILRSLSSVIIATVRTNYWVTDQEGDPRPYLSVKLDPQRIAGLPEPRPHSEMFVYSPRVEGVHLRFGEISRGGLRWSDRREDFRTEILELAKAQAVKNAVIVPVGAKGGFVVKRPPAVTGDPAADADAYHAEGVSCYRMFISGLLDLTDNLVDGVSVPAPRVTRYDGDDNYLVVAADRGTAKFSDIANEVSASYGFWLGDAFASGGSVGYDHKDMGITARGAWESVKRHFRELDVDTQRESFSVAGIGDMAGDVFGNGMLRSAHIRLVAAFNHRHIVLDPDPDTAASYTERERLFELPGSSWDDYDRAVLSEGGGIHRRDAKSVQITPQVRQSLGLADDVTSLRPAELIRAILTAPVDLLWNGGVGTYVKAASESSPEVGDKANDAVRVNGGQLRARVVGEGGNLGVTPRGRIEYARAGGRINTDAVDNSAGVDASDHEVNIKIFLDQLVAEQRLDRAHRDELLLSMTDEVGMLVLANNYRQNKVLGIGRAHAASMLSVHQRLIGVLEAQEGLDRELAALPGDAELTSLAAAGCGLSSPELATLLAHVKLNLEDEVQASDLPDTDVFAQRLPEYFPAPLRERFGNRLGQHPLRRELIGTMVVNEVVDGGGITFAFRLAEEANVSAADAIRAYAVVSSVYGLPLLWTEIDELDNIVSAEVLGAMVLQTRRLLDRAARWFLVNRPQPLAVADEISRFDRDIAELLPTLPGLLRDSEAAVVAEHTGRYVERGVPSELARRVAVSLHGYGLLDVIEVAEQVERDSDVVAGRRTAAIAELYYALSDHLGINDMLSSVSELERGNRWHALARLALRDDLYSSLRAITLDVVRSSDSGSDVDDRMAEWEEANSSRLGRARPALDEMRQVEEPDLATLSVAARQIRSAVR